MFEQIIADIQRFTKDEKNLPSKAAVLLVHPGFHAVFLYRLSHWFSCHHLRVLAVFVAYWSSVLTGAQLSPRAVIGKGFLICHPTGVVVGPALIGDHCTLTQANLIGQRRGGGDRPSIGHHFYAGAGSKIIGRIRIGNNVRVGANAVVLDSIPDGATAFGVPAKVVLKD